MLARGPMSHLFQGIQEQSYLAHAMGYAACVGADLRHCHTQEEELKSTVDRITNGAARTCAPLLLAPLLLVLLSTLALLV